MDRQPATVLLADDQPVYLDAMVATLEGDDRFDVVGSVSSGAGCIEAHIRRHPDLTLVAVELDDICGLEVLRRIRHADPEARVCMTATRAQEHEVLDAAQAGACGFLDKHVIDTAELRRQVAVAAAGGDAYDARTLTAMMHALRTVERGGDGPARLTGRQMDVLRHIAAGRSNAQIADAMFVSVNTVKTYVRSVFAKLDVSDRAEAVARGYENGLLRHQRVR
jgi:DNA-binding NarL/FixJ family response regulator